MPTFAQAIRANQRAVMELAEPDLREILPVLYDIRAETARVITDFLKTNDGTSPYSLHKHRALMGQLDDTIEMIEKQLPAATVQQLKVGLPKIGKIATKNLLSMIQAGEKQFRGTISTLRLPIGAILKNVEKSVASRYPKSAKRYSGAIGDRLRHQLALGHIKGESIDEMARRMMEGKLGKGKKAKDIGEGIAENQFFKSVHDAERFIRTEQNGAYNLLQLEGLAEADTDDPGWYVKWDSSNDLRVCRECQKLDGEIVPSGRPFRKGLYGPPLHPNDRCGVIPWRKEWA